MAITPGQRDDILKVVVGLFGGAPGNIYLPELAAVVEGGVTREGLADLLADTAIFKTSIIGGNVTTEEQADILFFSGAIERHRDNEMAEVGGPAMELLLAREVLTEPEPRGEIRCDGLIRVEVTTESQEHEGVLLGAAPTPRGPVSQ